MKLLVTLIQIDHFSEGFGVLDLAPGGLDLEERLQLKPYLAFADSQFFGG